MILNDLPGYELYSQGVKDLKEGKETIAAYVVAIGAPRLRQLGLDIPEISFPNPEHGLYQFLAKSEPASAHSRYNAFIQRLVSFERSLSCAN